MRNIIGEEDIFVKYLKPEMDIVEFDESVLTSITETSSDSNLNNPNKPGNLPGLNNNGN